MAKITNVKVTKERHIELIRKADLLGMSPGAYLQRLLWLALEKATDDPVEEFKTLVPFHRRKRNEKKAREAPVEDGSGRLQEITTVKVSPEFHAELMRRANVLGMPMLEYVERLLSLARELVTDDLVEEFKMLLEVAQKRKRDER